MSCVSKTSNTSSFSSNEDDDDQIRRGPWTLEEDSILIHYVNSHGEGRWNLLAKRSGLNRTGKSCRLRWLNYLKPDVKRGNLTPKEQLLILELHCKWGNRWSKIAQHLPGRTDNEIKNYWRTRVQKQARHLKIDANSEAFQRVVRCFWVPRLLQKIQLESSLSSAKPCSTTDPSFNPQLNVISNLGIESNCTSASISSSESITTISSSHDAAALQVSINLPETNAFPAEDHCLIAQTTGFNPSLKGTGFQATNDTGCSIMDDFKNNWGGDNEDLTAADGFWNNIDEVCHQFWHLQERVLQ